MIKIGKKLSRAINTRGDNHLEHHDDLYGWTASSGVVELSEFNGYSLIIAIPFVSQEYCEEELKKILKVLKRKE